MKNLAVSTLILTVLAISGCQTDEAKIEAQNEKLLAEAKEFAETFKDHLSAADTITLFDFLENTYTWEKTELVTPEGTIVTGDALLPWYRAVMGQGYKYFNIDMEFFDESFTASGNIVLHRYSYELNLSPKQGGDMLSEIGHGIKIYQKDNTAQLRLIYDGWSTMSH